jgi:hypothetical protein
MATAGHFATKYPRYRSDRMSLVAQVKTMWREPNRERRSVFNNPKLSRALIAD